MMCEAPARHDRTAARHDASDAIGGQRHISEPYAGMDGEIIDALLSLLDQCIFENLPGEFHRIAADLFERLIDLHGSDRDRSLTDNPVAEYAHLSAYQRVHDG